MVSTGNTELMYEYEDALVALKNRLDIFEQKAKEAVNSQLTEQDYEQSIEKVTILYDLIAEEEEKILRFLRQRKEATINNHPIE